jgi:hypothetical protein
VIDSARRAVRFAALAAPATLVTLAIAREVRADEGKRTSSLAWVRLEGAESCVAGAALARSVEDRLKRKVFVSASDADLSIEGSIGPAGPGKQGFRAVLRVTSREGAVLGSREVETRAAHCDAIDEKLSLIVSVLIDPDAGNEEPAPSEPSALPPPPNVIERERVVVVHDGPEHEPPPIERWNVALAIDGTLLAGLQPSVGLGVAASVVLRPPHFWGVLLGGGISASTMSDLVRGASAEASFADGVIGLCPLDAKKYGIEATACAGALVGALQSRGVGFDTTSSSSSIVAGPMVTGRVTLALVGPLVAHLGVDVVVPFSQAEVGYRTPAGESTLFRTSAVAGMGELGLGVRFP